MQVQPVTCSAALPAQMGTLVDACVAYIASQLHPVALACPDLGALPTDLFVRLAKVRGCTLQQVDLHIPRGS
jgi:hypothetical protein